MNKRPTGFIKLENSTGPLVKPAHYLDKATVSPGDRVEIMATGEGSATAQLVRLRGLHGSPMPYGYEEEEIGQPEALTLVHRDVPKGSFAQTVEAPRAAAASAWRWSLRLFPTLTDWGEVVAWGDGGPMLRVVEGRLEGVWNSARVSVPISAHAWWEATFARNTEGELSLDLRPRGPDAAFRPSALACKPGPRDGVAGSLTFGRGFNGKIESPSFELDGVIVAAWDFADDMRLQRVPGRGPQARTLTLVNTPRRGVTASTWSGASHDWTQRPDHYGAIHFHDDDLADCAWPVDAAVTVPHAIRSGVYAMRLKTQSAVHYTPAFVRAERPAEVAFLASTFSYLAYGNTIWEPRDANSSAQVVAQSAQADRFGLSMYCRHRDGSGIGLVSSRRPILNATPGFMGEAVGAQVLFNDDLRIIAWLERSGHAYDVVTDDDLHMRGVDALAGRRVLITGSHPEYHSARSLDACERFVDGGGRLIYMGGNGFYWRVDTLADAPHVMELRRAESGIRIWAEPPGEYHHQSDGGLGGLWRRLGRPPNRLIGVGFSAQGSESESRPFMRTPAAANPRVAFLFEGVRDGEIGLNTPHGAVAGYEVDRADEALGTPPGTIIVARSTPFGPLTHPVNEERLTHGTLDAVDPLRADIAYHERPGGGAVVAFSSILFATGLEDGDGVERLATNALNGLQSDQPMRLDK